jgi:hypothetical protein
VPTGVVVGAAISPNTSAVDLPPRPICLGVGTVSARLVRPCHVGLRKAGTGCRSSRSRNSRPRGSRGGRRGGGDGRPWGDRRGQRSGSCGAGSRGGDRFDRARGGASMRPGPRAHGRNHGQYADGGQHGQRAPPSRPTRAVSDLEDERRRYRARRPRPEATRLGCTTAPPIEAVADRVRRTRTVGAVASVSADHGPPQILKTGELAVAGVSPCVGKYQPILRYAVRPWHGPRSETMTTAGLWRE